MTAGLDQAVTGTAAGVPFLALPPAGGRSEPAPMIALWHPLGIAGSPDELAAVLPLGGVPAWRIYFALPGAGSRAPAAAGSDLVLDIYSPMIEQAAAEFAAARAALRDMLPVDDGPVAVVGSSAGGHTALRVLTAGEVPVAAAAVINPAVRTESVVAVNERFGDFSYTWSEQARQRTAALDIVAVAAQVRAPVLLVTGQDEYPEFRPDQAALAAALGGPVSQVVIPGMGHSLEGDAVRQADRVVTEWMKTRFG